MPERLFVFIQFEFPWVLGPAEGRYLLREGAGGEPQRVVVLGTLDGGGPRQLARDGARGAAPSCASAGGSAASVAPSPPSRRL